MKNKLLRGKYTTNGRVYQLKIKDDVDVLIAEDDPVRLLDEKLEGMDYTQLHRAYSPRGKKPKTSPVTMFKVIVYGMTEGIYSKREIAKKCKRDVNYMWLLNDEPAPTHDALTWFCSHQLAAVIEDLFYQMVKALCASGEIRYEHLFVDGTKIEANANRYSFVWKKRTTKYESRINEKLSVLHPELCSEHGVSADTAEVLLTRLEAQMCPIISTLLTNLQRHIHLRFRWHD